MAPKTLKDLLKDPRLIKHLPLDKASECTCAFASPSGVAEISRGVVMASLPMARKHLDHYLAGTGRNLMVDLDRIIREDTKFRAKLRQHTRKRNRGFFGVAQGDYSVRDFAFALGAIDRVDFQIDRKAGLVHVWFMDRYEWHPVGFGYTTKKGDIRRETNCVHAAMVELKAEGAADYWMLGDTVVKVAELKP